MKKFAALFAVSLFVVTFFGCTFHNLDTETYSTIITNKSSLSIQFSYNGTVYTLAQGADTTLNMTKSDTISLLNNPRATSKKSYDYTNDYWKITISDMTPVNYKIVNSSSLSITLSEKNGMLTDTCNGTLTIAAGATELVNVYTSSPSFSAVYTTSSVTANCTINSTVVTVY